MRLLLAECALLDGLMVGLDDFSGLNGSMIVWLPVE